MEQVLDQLPGNGLEEVQEVLLLMAGLGDDIT